MATLETSMKPDFCRFERVLVQHSDMSCGNRAVAPEEFAPPGSFIDASTLSKLFTERFDVTHKERGLTLTEKDSSTLEIIGLRIESSVLAE